MKDAILKIVDIFGKQEMGNRLSEFAWLGLKVLLSEEIDKQLAAREQGQIKADK